MLIKFLFDALSIFLMPMPASNVSYAWRPSGLGRWRVQDLGFRDVGFRVSALGIRIYGLEFQVSVFAK